VSNKPAPEKPETIALLTAIPADLREALEERFELAEPGADLPAGTRIAVTTAMRGLSSEDLARHAGLELVLSQGVGLEKLDLKAASAAGVQVSVTPNILTEDVADFAIGLTYAICRRIAEADRFVRAGRWGPERIRPSTSLRGKRMGIVGMGRIGQAIARRAAGLEMQVSYTGPSKKDGVTHDYVADVRALAAQSDVLVLACPGGAATHHLCDRAVLEALGADGFLVNVARGSVVDEPALLEALAEARIAGAALDVFAREPGLDPAFVALENVVLTPHSASITREVRAELIAAMLSDAEAFVAGKPLKNVANPGG
jgi:lactate dehydrogenase-like 2-hydroxyacid dehydrogenase